MADLDTIKVILRSLLISTQRPMTAYDLARDYKSTEGHECPYARLGYNSFSQFLDAIPDTVTVLRNGLVKAVSTSETYHIQRLVETQRNSKKRRPMRKPYRGQARYVPPPRFNRSSDYSFSPSYSSRSSYTFTPSRTIDQHFQKVQEAKRNMDKLRVESAASGPSVSGETFIKNWPSQQTVEVKPEPGVRIVPEILDSDSDDSYFERFDESSKEDEILPSNNINNNEGISSEPYAINDILKDNLRNLIKGYPSGLWACVLPEKYKEKYGAPLNWIELGYDSVIQMAHELLDVFVCKRKKTGDWLLFDASAKLPVDTSDEEEIKPGPVVPDSVKRKIYDIVKRYSSGVRGEQVAQLYQEYYGKPLIAEATDFDNVEALFLSLQDTVIHMRYIRKEYYVYPGKEPERVSIPVLNESDSKIKKELGLYPEEVLGPGEFYTPPELPSNLEVGNYLEVKVAEIYNPHKFWILMRNSYGDLDRMMDELQDFYRDHGEKYKMPDATLCVAQCCAALYDGEWHRALIKSLGEMIEVSYVDFGTISKVSKDDLRFIHRDFCVLPIQAIRASLSTLQPPGGAARFSREANQKFLELVVEKSLIGLVNNFDREVPSLELFLIDTTGENDIHLNDVLVSLKYAEYKQETNDLDESKDKYVPQDKGVIPQPECKDTVDINSDPVQEPKSAYSGIAPPGFSAFANQPSDVAMAMLGSSPFMNPSLAAYAQYSSQVNAALVLQQQIQAQQQALALAYYQSLYQQSLAGFNTKAPYVSNPWTGVPLTAPHFGTPQSGPNLTNPQGYQIHNINNGVLPDVRGVETGRIKTGSQEAVKESMPKQTSSAMEVPSSCSDSDSLDDCVVRKKKMTRKKSLQSTLSPSGFKLGLVQETQARESENQRTVNLNSSETSSTKSRQFENVLNSLEQSLSDMSDHSFDSARNIRNDVSKLSVPSHHTIPDLVQCLGNLNMSPGKHPVVINFWKIHEIDSKPLHVFNIDNQGFVSTGELARQFTEFSTCDTLVRVLTNLDINPTHRKLSRSDKLCLFSALDAYEDEKIKSFDLVRNKAGNVTGSFHLSQLSVVPSMLIPLGVHNRIIKEFQRVRDSFNPDDKYWFM